MPYTHRQPSHPAQMTSVKEVLQLVLAAIQVQDVQRNGQMPCFPRHPLPTLKSNDAPHTLPTFSHLTDELCQGGPSTGTRAATALVQGLQRYGPTLLRPGRPVQEPGAVAGGYGAARAPAVAATAGHVAQQDRRNPGE